MSGFVYSTERPKGQRTRLNSTSLHLELDCELGTIQVRYFDL